MKTKMGKGHGGTQDEVKLKNPVFGVVLYGYLRQLTYRPGRI